PSIVELAHGVFQELLRPRLVSSLPGCKSSKNDAIGRQVRFPSGQVERLLETIDSFRLPQEHLRHRAVIERPIPLRREPYGFIEISDRLVVFLFGAQREAAIAIMPSNFGLQAQYRIEVLNCLVVLFFVEPRQPATPYAKSRSRFQ